MADTLTTLLSVKKAATAAKVYLGDLVQICTGTDDQILIRAAIYELASTCGEVTLSAGTFGIYDSIYLGVNPSTTANLIISGEGRSTVLESHDKQGGGGYNVIFMDEDGWTVKDLVIDGALVSSDLLSHKPIQL